MREEFPAAYRLESAAIEKMKSGVDVLGRLPIRQMLGVRVPRKIREAGKSFPEEETDLVKIQNGERTATKTGSPVIGELVEPGTDQSDIHRRLPKPKAPGQQ